MSDKDLELLISLALSEGCEIETGNIRQHDKILAKRQAQQQVVLDRIAKDKADAERWRKLDRLTDKVCGDIFIHANGKAKTFWLDLVHTDDEPIEESTLSQAIDSIKE